MLIALWDGRLTGKPAGTAWAVHHRRHRGCPRPGHAPAPLAKLLAFPAFPITPTILPFPLPSRYRLWFGEPMCFAGSPDDEDSVLEEKVQRVRAAVADLLARGLEARPHVFW